VPEWERIVIEVQLIAERMVRGEFGVDGATDEMDRRVDLILEKRRKLVARGRNL
jgi:multiple sugar transport system substrate-binding protein